MNFIEYRVKFSIEALNSGYTQQTIDKCLEYAKPLIEGNLPVVYNLSHLAFNVRYKKEYIQRAVLFTDFFYRDFKIKKRNGDFRKISEPLPSLKEIQHWILNQILYKIKVSPFAKAYKIDTPINENLKFHKNQPKVLTVDIENFFPSINKETIEKVFVEVGYSKSVSNLLAKLCCKNNSLPQGAPTSPYLSNIIFKSYDEQISEYCVPNKIRYTRYADDLSFSGDFDEKKLYQFLEEIFLPTNFKLNHKKTKLMLSHMRQTVTGIVVNEKPQVVFHKRNKLRQEMYYIQKFGLDNHMKYKKITKQNYLEHILGKINFILQINPKDQEFKKYKEYLVSLKKERELI